MSEPAVVSPSQTIGPLYGYALMFDGCECAVEPDDPRAVRVEGLVLDGAGQPVAYPESMVEVWQGEQWARGRADEHGRFHVLVRKPEATPLPDGTPQAPHLELAVFARGLLRAARTRIYFPDEAEANEADPVLARVPEASRGTLIAVPAADGALRFDVRLQGEGETAFFEL